MRRSSPKILSLMSNSQGKRHVPVSEVTFKELDAESSELDLLEYLNTEENRDDPWNHSVPILDIVPHEKHVVAMMLRLQPFDSPPFQNVAECLDLTRQLLEVCRAAQPFFSFANMALHILIEPCQSFRVSPSSMNTKSPISTSRRITLAWTLGFSRSMHQTGTGRRAMCSIT